MTNIDITTLSSKGQIVIPFDMREGIKAGDKMVIIRNGDQIIIKKADAFSKNLEEDLEFARRTEKAWQQIDKGDYTSYSKEAFLKIKAKVQSQLGYYETRYF
jgi:AbrB family looped-hinge helix DNA binding protein